MARTPCLVAIGICVVALAVASAGATQIVFLDFDSGTDHPHVYTAFERASIKSIMEGHYSLFDFAFTLAAPGAGDFSTIVFNHDPLGGLASDIDHRNLNMNDTATVNAVALLDLIPPFMPNTEARRIALTSLIGSHELGHLQGLRHADSLGPIGTGIIAGGPFFSVSITPPYPGPIGLADEIGFHLMASPGSVGQSPDQATSPAFFGERSAIKLAFNETGTVVVEFGGNNTMGTAQALTLGSLDVPNPLEYGKNHGMGWYVDAINVAGELTASQVADWYSFVGQEDELFNIQVISDVVDRHREALPLEPDFILELYDSSGVLVDYYATDAEADDEFEYSFDPFLWDIVLPKDDTYFVKIRGNTDPKSLPFPGIPDPFPRRAFGTYDLFIFSFATPEPGSFALLAAGLGFLGFAVHRRRRT